MTLALVTASVIGLLVLVAAWRSHRQLVSWLALDPYIIRRSARALALAACAGLLAFAWVVAAQQPPRFSGAGIDLVMAVDVSRSMDTEDSAPSRMRRAQRLLERVVLEAKGVRLGLVMFAGDAYVALPLTLDRDAHLAYIQALDSDIISNRGTDLVRALQVSSDVFDPRSPRPRVLLLLSDGEHAGGGLDDTLVALRGAGVRTVAVGFGTEQGDIVPGPNGGAMFDRSGLAIVSRRSDAMLERIANATGGRYYRELEDAPDPADLIPAVEELRERGEVPAAGPLTALIAGAALLLALELLLSSAPVALPSLWRHRSASAALALGLVGCPQGWVQEGDANFADGKVQEALSLYRRMERTYGVAPDTQIRIGNALYRMDEPDRASAAYLEALRRLEEKDGGARFVASFNLGNSLLQQEHFDEAREQFWTALREDPRSLEAKFNYEWAAARTAPPEPPPPAPPSPNSAPADGAGEGEATDADGASGESSGQGVRESRELREPQAAPDLSETEARRWLETIEDALDAPLRRQVNESLGAKPRRRVAGQTW